MFPIKTWKDKKTWIAGIDALDTYSQGRTRKHAILMLKDAILELSKSEFGLPHMRIETPQAEKQDFMRLIDKYAIALLLKRTRQRFGLTQADVVKKLKCQKNAYAQYEQARRIPTIDQLEKFISAMQKEQHLIISLAKAS